MPITYPITLPSAVGPRSVRITPRNVVGGSVSPFTGEQQTYQHQGQWWELEIGWGPLPAGIADDLCAAILSLSGRYGTFLFGDPMRATPRGIATGTPLVMGAAQTGQALITDGWTAGVTGILKAGDYLQLGTGSTARLHRVMQDANSNGSGQATFDIWPRLRSSPADNAAITVSNCKGVFRLAANDVGWMLEDVKTNGIVLPAIEAL
jgi:hypothetical protein